MDCVYIETKKHKLLLDAGQTDALIRNAKITGIDLSQVDTVILSHGHYDHSGGLIPFYRNNDKAVLYMHRSAAEPHFNGERYIGIAPEIMSLPNIVTLDGDYKIDDELFIFTGIKGRRCYPQGNKKLLREENGIKIPDNFAHEQCLVVTQNRKKYLLSGCAHNGILNILDKYKEIFGDTPDYVISGFHMMKREGEYTPAEKDVIIQTAEELARTDTVFFSGHCTGEPAFNMMKEIMGDQLRAIRSGEEIQF